jgi:serine O-acetyltransferase
MSDDFIKKLFERNNERFANFPDKARVQEFAESLFQFLFIPLTGSDNTEFQLHANFKELRHRFSSILSDILAKGPAIAVAEQEFFDALPHIYAMLLEDAEAILRFDPAAESLEEVLIAYPGFFATAIYRLAHQLYLQHIFTIPRLLSEYAHSKTGIDIHPGATIGESFFIDHGTGIVIGESVIIGNNVKIYQGVTLGALNVAKEYARHKRHPTIEDNVIIYSGATVLGGDTVVGHDSIIGGNVWLTESVSPDSVVYHKSEIVVRGNRLLPEPLNFII